MRAAVVDASVAVKWVLPEPDSDSAVALRDKVLHAPDLALAECGNALWVRVHRGVLSKAEAEICFAALSLAPVRWTPTGQLAAEAMALALDLDHPVYDCVYLALAIARDLPLVTADRRLIATAQRRPEIASHVRPLNTVE